MPFSWLIYRGFHQSPEEVKKNANDQNHDYQPNPGEYRSERVCSKETGCERETGRSIKKASNQAVTWSPDQIISE